MSNNLTSKNLIDLALNFQINKDINKQPFVDSENPILSFIYSDLADHCTEILCLLLGEQSFNLEDGTVYQLFCPEDSEFTFFKDNFGITGLNILNTNQSIPHKTIADLKLTSSLNKDGDRVIEIVYPQIIDQINNSIASDEGSFQESLRFGSALRESIDSIEKGSDSDKKLYERLAKDFDRADNDVVSSNIVSDESFRASYFAQISANYSANANALIKANEYEKSHNELLKILTPLLNKLSPKIQKSLLDLIFELKILKDESDILTKKCIEITADVTLQRQFLNNPPPNQVNDLLNDRKSSRSELKSLMLQLDLMSEISKYLINLTKQLVDPLTLFTSGFALNKTIGIIDFEKSSEGNDLYISSIKFKDSLTESRFLNGILGKSFSEVFSIRDSTGFKPSLFSKVESQEEAIKTFEANNEINEDTYSSELAKKISKMDFLSVNRRFGAFTKSALGSVDTIADNIAERVIDTTAKESFSASMKKIARSVIVKPIKFAFRSFKALGFFGTMIAIQCILMIPDVISIFRENFCKQFDPSREGFICKEGGVIEDTMKYLQQKAGKIRKVLYDSAMEAINAFFFKTTIGRIVLASASIYAGWKVYDVFFKDDEK